MKSNIIFLSIFSLFLSGAIHASDRISTIFCHGIVTNNHKIEPYIGHTIISNPVTFDFPDAEPTNSFDLNGLIYNISSFFNRPVNRNAMYMGQGKDIETLHQIYSQQNNDVILYGASRGGMAILEYIATYNPTNLQAIVLESTPTDMVTIVQNICSYLYLPIASNYQLCKQLFCTIFPQYPMHATPPINIIENIQNNSLPIFLVYSETDHLVHHSQADVYHQALEDLGFNNVHLVKIKSGKHGYLYLSDDFHEYKKAINKFYQQYDLPHLQSIT